MSKAACLTVAVSLAAILTGLPAMAQQPNNHNQPPPKKPVLQKPVVQKPLVQGQPKGPSGPAPRGGPAAAQFHGPGPGSRGQFHAARAIGARGYSFRGAYHGRRGITTFNERERTVWYGGHWRHERRFGRDGYWWEVNGVWYFYDQPLDGPPDYVSEVEFSDDGLDPGGPVDAGPPPPVVVVVPPPPPVVCIGPLCVR
jgi:hypothetical protein